MNIDVDLHALLVIIGLALVTVVTRCFFLFSTRPWSLPHWAQRGLQFAPIAALAVVIVPEVVMTQGRLITTWQDARMFAAIAGAGAYYWRRDVLATILVGMAVYLPLHLGWNW